MRYLSVHCPNGAMTRAEWSEYAWAMYERFGYTMLRTESTMGAP